MRKLIVILIAVLFILFVVNGLTSYAQGKTGEFSGKIFTEAPENPKDPGEVAAAFYLLLKEEKYSKAEELVSVNALGEFQNNKSELKDVMQVVKNVEIGDEDMLNCSYWCVSVRFIENGITGNYVVDKKTLDKIRKGGAGKVVYVYLTLHIVDNSKYAEFGGEDKYLGYKQRATPVELIKQNGKWKISWSIGRSFIKAPKRLDTPEKVVVAFFFLLKEEKYAEAMKLMVHNPFEEYGLDESMIVLDNADKAMQGLQKIRVNRRDILEKSYWEVTLYSVERGSKGTYYIDEETFNTVKKGKGKPVKIEYNGETEIVKLVSVNEEHLAYTEAEIFITFFFCTTNSWESSQRTELVNLDGEWKIVE